MHIKCDIHLNLEFEHLLKVMGFCILLKLWVKIWRITKPQTTDRRPITDNRSATHRQILHQPPTTDAWTTDRSSTDPPNTEHRPTNSLTHRPLTHRPFDSPNLFSQSYHWTNSFINLFQFVIHIGCYLLLNS